MRDQQWPGRSALLVTGPGHALQRHVRVPDLQLRLQHVAAGVHQPVPERPRDLTEVPGRVARGLSRARPALVYGGRARPRNVPSGRATGPGSAEPGPVAETRSALLGHADDVALRVGDQREGHAGHVLGLLNDLAAKFPGPVHGAVDVIHRDEEGDQIAAPLQRADRRVQGVWYTCVHERVARDRPLVVGPSEQVTEELAGSVRVGRPDLRVHDWMRHLCSLSGSQRAPLRRPPCTHHERDDAASDEGPSRPGARRPSPSRPAAATNREQATMSPIAGELVTETFGYDGGRQVTVYVPPAPPEAVVFAGDGQLTSQWGRALEAAGVLSTMIVGVHRL